MWWLSIHQNCYKKFFTFLSSSIIMSRNNVNFGGRKMKKSDFYKIKKVACKVKIDDIDVNKILVSKEEPYGTKNSFKYSIRYNDDDVIRPLCISFYKWMAMLENLKMLENC